MSGPVERVHTGWRLRALYPLGGRVPALARVPPRARRATRRGLTALAVHAHRRAVRRARVAAVTGSHGKTTVKDLLGAMLAAAGPTAITPENDNGVYGVPATLLALRPGDAFAVVEAGVLEAPGEMRWMAGLIRPDVAVLTAIGDDHDVAFGGRAGLLAEKRELLRAVPSGGTVVLGAGVDPRAADGVRARVLRVGEDVALRSAALAWPHGMDVEIEAADGGVHRARVALHALHLAPLVPVALAAASALGAAPAAALRGAGSLRPRPGRFAPAPGPGGSTLILDEHKSRVGGAVAALDALAAIPARRRIAVLGEVQDRPHTAAAYAPIAAAAARADAVIAVGRAAPFLPGARVAAGVEEAAALLAAARPGPGDVVLVHGATRQHLLRVALLAAGAPVGCRVARCTLHWRCTACPHLQPGPPDGVVEAR